MKKTPLILLFAAFLLFFASCEDAAEQISNLQKDAAKDQSVVDGYFNEANDMSTRAFQAPSANDLSGGRSGGRSITITVSGDTRFQGATVTLEPTGTNPLAPQGRIIIDFGTGKTDPAGVTRRGRILLSYRGLRFVPQSTTELTFDNYFVNNVKIEGTRTVRTTALDNTSITFEVTDAGGKAIFPDGRTITREASLVLRLTFGANAGNSFWSLTGTMRGVTREGSEYRLVIERALIYKAECLAAKVNVPVEGIAVLTVGTLAMTVDYGNGACDNLATLTVGGVSQEITVNE
jgi:hypothetical protein